MTRDNYASARPARIKAPDFAGRLRILPEGAQYWQHASAKSSPDTILLLGTGPANTESLPFIRDAIQKSRTIYWLESPAMRSHIKKENIPGEWREVSPKELKNLLKNADIWFYKPGMTLDPIFWGKLLAEIEIINLPAITAQADVKSAWLPGSPRQLLHQELLLALGEANFTNVCQLIPEKPTFSELEKIWNQRPPDFILSVNFRGLDGNGHIFHLCESLGIPLSIWLVDNPWNLLSAIPLPWWKQASLFLTDQSFIEPLKKIGGRHVHFCPLAMAQHMPGPIPSHNNGQILFVGRSEFPEKNSFFKGLSIPPELLANAQNMLRHNARPDYHWCAEQFNIKPWPGLEGRKISFCADEFSAMNRAMWLEHAQDLGLRIIGDNGWRKFLPQAEIMPPVDYYGKLPQFYREAGCVLNITSLLLPCSLNQRHFDVWAAGGFLLTDATPGLRLFPEALTSETAIASPGQIPQKLEWLANNREKKREIQEAWRELLRKEHTYKLRIEMMYKMAKADLSGNYADSPMK